MGSNFANLIHEGFLGFLLTPIKPFPSQLFKFLSCTEVTGLCKLATLEEIKEQDYSLNPGRYVGVVIEEDGKTEEEFLADLLQMNQQLSALNETAIALGEVITRNVDSLAGSDEGD